MQHQYYTLITGASEGFGKALAIECARRKMNLILVALPGVALHHLARFIKSNFGVSVVAIEKDLCADNSCLELFQEVSAMGYQVNMLFNNAGTGSTGRFEEGDILLYERQIKLNVLATTAITHLFLNMLKRNSPSYILNVSSLACYFPLPKKQVYGATKSYIYYFSKCLRKELRQNNVSVSVLCPGAMNTNKAVQLLIKKGNFFIRNSTLNPEQVAPPVIDGVLKKKGVMVPGLLNKCYIVMYSILPDFIKTIITNRSMKDLSSITEKPMVMKNTFIMKSSRLASNTSHVH